MKRLFKKHFIIQILIFVITFVILGFCLIKSFSDFSMNQRRELLIEHSNDISNIFKSGYFFDGYYNFNELQSKIILLQEYLGMSFIYTDDTDIIRIVSGDISQKWLGKQLEGIKKTELNSSGNRLYIEMQGTINNMFSKPMFVMGSSLEINENYLGIIYLAMPIGGLLDEIEHSYRLLVLFTILSAILLLYIIYMFGKKITRPLSNVTSGAKIMATGDYKQKIEVLESDEIGELAEILNGMAKRLDENDRKSIEFISNISHDIRSPLTSIQGFLQAIIDGTIPDNKKERYLTIVLEETQRVILLANNLLDITKLEQNTRSSSLSEFDINELIRNIAISFETKVLEKQLQINLIFEQAEVKVNTNKEKLQRIIYNLVDNAVKFTNNNKTVYISTMVKDGKICISVRDEAHGLSEIEKTKVFDRFYKTDYSRGKDKNGSGLGLSIVKELAMSLGGKVYVNSELGHGSEFVIELPIEVSKI